MIAQAYRIAYALIACGFVASSLWAIRLGVNAARYSVGVGLFCVGVGFLAMMAGGWLILFGVIGLP
jgi:hypothetical protein